MKKRLTALLLALCTMAALSVPALATERLPKARLRADYLYENGLFRGTGTDANGQPIYELERTATRAEGLVMFLRILGKEEEALAGSWDIPFIDVPQWCRPYVGYAYANGLTSGTSATTFSPGATISAQQFATFCLRALGYPEGIWFTYDRVFDLAEQLDVAGAQWYDDTLLFTRGEMAMMAYQTLLAEKKEGETTFREDLGLEPIAFPTLDDDAIWADFHYEPFGQQYHAKGVNDGDSAYAWWMMFNVMDVGIQSSIQGLVDYKFPEDIKIMDCDGNIIDPYAQGKNFAIYFPQVNPDPNTGKLVVSTRSNASQDMAPLRLVTPDEDEPALYILPHSAEIDRERLLNQFASSDYWVGPKESYEELLSKVRSGNLVYFRADGNVVALREGFRGKHFLEDIEQIYDSEMPLRVVVRALEDAGRLQKK